MHQQLHSTCKRILPTPTPHPFHTQPHPIPHPHLAKRESLIARLGTIIDNGFSVRRRCDDPPPSSVCVLVSLFSSLSGVRDAERCNMSFS